MLYAARNSDGLSQFAQRMIYEHTLIFNDSLYKLHLQQEEDVLYLEWAEFCWMGTGSFVPPVKYVYQIFAQDGP